MGMTAKKRGEEGMVEVKCLIARGKEQKWQRRRRDEGVTAR